ncbi:hypothetical protein CANCADRAFT_147585 [Tortispora caseinolytica NRRL Y-17796]|uniref:Vacuolar protein sorting-associated protein 28 n=1 Tax=Tortispora caseinolytica NRRL Y-17796 TaxID=767744 RepID=A0A1E4TL07_9ASCO|nr:hypothetical protein CANCADRAFT_147585 [Tortispora caseinolytica NRRL Y-17796]
MQSYAPHFNSRNSLVDNQEITLFESSQEREIYENLAELYSIITTLDLLEKAYIRDSILPAEYTPLCARLLAQYKTLLKNHEVIEEFGDLESFKLKYNISCPSATQRLAIGVPATLEQGSIASSTPAPPESASNTSISSAYPQSAPNNYSARAAADATGNFITFMDAVKLNYKAKDQLHPLLSELMTSINKVTTADFEGRPKIVQWLITLNAMNATDEISDDQQRELLFDINSAYESFYKTLG